MSGQVLITGGAGFIGYHLAKHLAASGYSVCLVDNHTRGIIDDDLKQLLIQPKVTLTEIDLLDRDAVLDLGIGFEAIYHLGAIIGVKNVLARPFDVLVDNTRMLENVIVLARQQKSCSRLLFASTSEVYAGTLKYFDLTVPTPENVALAVTALNEPRTSYMLSKIMGEAMVQQAGVPFTIFRPHNIYGPRMGMAHVIPEQLNKAFDSKPGDRLDVCSPGHTRAFCYIDDAVAMLHKMLTTESCIGQTLNLGTEAPEVTIREVVKTCIAATDKNLGINDLAPTSGSPVRRAPDMRLTKSLLNLESKVSLDEGITRTWNWYRKQVFENGGPSAR